MHEYINYFSPSYDQIPDQKLLNGEVDLGASLGVQPIRKGIGMPWWQEQLQLLKQEYKATTAGNTMKQRELQISRFTHKASH